MIATQVFDRVMRTSFAMARGPNVFSHGSPEQIREIADLEFETPSTAIRRLLRRGLAVDDRGSSDTREAALMDTVSPWKNLKEGGRRVHRGARFLARAAGRRSS